MPRLRSERGAALVELAIVVPLLVSIVAAVSDFGLLFRTYEVTTNAAREGARLAAIPGNEQNNYATVKTRVADYLAICNLTGPHTVTVTPVTITTGPLNANGARVDVTYDYTFLFLGPAVSLMNGTFGSTLRIQSAALMRVQIAGIAP